MEFRRRRKIDAAIDMTPMIDTLLQLFVVFLLSMSFVASSVRLELPRASAQPTTADAPIAVSLDGDGKLFFNNEPIAAEQLSGRLAAALKDSENRQVLLRGDRKLPYERIMATLVDLQRAGAANVLLAYESER